MTNKEWFKQAKFGMFIHWGLYSVLGGQWKHGPYYPYYGEWIQNRLQIPIKEYEPLTAAFNPIFFDAEEWVTMAKEAGMEYLVITSKHHDGFALFKSEVDRFNVVDATPFGRDIIAELAAACKKHGLRFGLYYSQYVDWHEEHAGGWRADKDGPCKTWSNYWDFPDHSGKDFNIAWEKKLKPQLREILTRYGDIATLWCDTPYGKNEEESRMVYEFIKSVNPDVLVNTRVGNGYGDYVVMADNQIPDEFMDAGVLAESPITLNKTWGYRAFDQDWKDADRVLEIKKHLNDRGVNLLINIGPDHLGRFPSGAVKVLRDLAERRRNEAK
ncbi:MAG: alpha-L-fucosidase [Clostridia bacterium]|nr:alpha-L-fucosidase [Clostridia bacterium]